MNPHYFQPDTQVQPKQSLINPTRIQAHKKHTGSVPVAGNESYFVVDLLLNKVVEEIGFQSLFGFDVKRVCLRQLKDAIHPDDRNYVLRIYNAVLFKSRFFADEIHKNILNICYRVQVKPNKYKHLLNRIYVEEVQLDGTLNRILVKCEDVSFMHTTSEISWESSEADESLTKEANPAHHAFLKRFTDRELEIAQHILQGKTNVEISEALHISSHTVATHRKHIFKKANCHSPSELILQFHKKGVCV